MHNRLKTTTREAPNKAWILECDFYNSVCQFFFFFPILLMKRLDVNVLNAAKCFVLILIQYNVFYGSFVLGWYRIGIEFLSPLFIKLRSFLRLYQMIKAWRQCCVIYRKLRRICKRQMLCSYKSPHCCVDYSKSPSQF